MWVPKSDNFSKYYGRPITVYCNNYSNRKIESGILVKISKNHQGCYSVIFQYKDNESKPLVTITSSLIRRVEVVENKPKPEINDVINIMCNKYLVSDMTEEIGQYLHSYIAL